MHASPDESCSDKGHSLATDTLADSVLILLSLTAVQRLVGFLRAVLFCRWLDPEELGQWDLAFGFLLLAAPVSVLAVSSSLGRYLEYYRQRRQLRMLLRRTATACAGLGLLASVSIYLADRRVSEWIFGTADRASLAALLALSLVSMIGLNYCIDLFSALRNVRLLAGLQMLHSLMFAVLGIALILAWQPSAEAVVVAHMAACLIACVWAGIVMRRRWPALPEDGAPPRSAELWAKLLPFTGWVWAASLLGNLFDIADRYMIVHLSPGSPAEALTQVGYYHSSRVVPLLLVSVATLLAPTITPHLSHDWEAGRRDRVSARLNLLLKLIGFLFATMAVIVLFASPLLFGVAFRGKLGGGEAVLPWTLTYCLWFGLSVIAQNYLWCAEKARLGSLALLVGLAVNVSLNLVLLPRYGLHGAVVATTVANLVALTLVCSFGALLGFQIHLGTCIVLAVPAVFPLGPWAALTVLIGVALDALVGNLVLTADERRQVFEGWLRYRQWLVGLRPAKAES